jgi:DNA mismatch endonuclease, patch repair protein
MDVLTERQRSHCMSRIRGRNTGPELLLRKALWIAGLRYRLHYSIAGRPDITFPGPRVAVFVDGCF